MSVEAANLALANAVFAPTAAPGRTPAALSASHGRYGLEFAPQAAANPLGGTDTGAELRVTRTLGKAGGPDEGGYFLYASAARRSVDLPPDARRWSGDDRGLVSDLKAGVGWRNGSTETTLGYVKRKVPQAYTANGLERRGGGMVGFSLTFRPGS
ncbi:MAG: hypothetical protein IT546_03535 [Caulobacteraceae bacterium]|nr:hypothetical protein [Caulobacteraceae bacterium]